MAPNHAHMLVVGWFLQFAVGVAYWLLPRRRTPGCPLGYREQVAWLAIATLNIGLALRIAAESAERTRLASNLTLTLLGASVLLHVTAVLIFVIQLWPRVATRQARAKLAVSS